MMSIGGAISTSSEMHRFLVEQHHWLSQDAVQRRDRPGPGRARPQRAVRGPDGLARRHERRQPGAALFGVLVTMVGIMTPSTIITYTAARWGHRNRELRAVRAFKQGMAPVVIALLLSTAWILGSSVGGAAGWRCGCWRWPPAW
jgi:chromate transporter